jgi:hypothetical protein
MNLLKWLGELGTVSRTRTVQPQGSSIRTQEMTLRWHQGGMARTPACQKHQMFFSDVTGTCLVMDLRISESLRVSGLGL